LCRTGATGRPGPASEMATACRPTFASQFLSGVSFVGQVVATRFFAASLTPSLLPRHFAVQGVLSGLALAVGYAVGVSGVLLWHYPEFREIYEHWKTLARGSRPKLYLQGLSLGSLGSESSADLFTILEDPIQWGSLERPSVLPEGNTNWSPMGGWQGAPWSRRSVPAVSLASLSVHQRRRCRVHFPAGRACCPGARVSRGMRRLWGVHEEAWRFGRWPRTLGGESESSVRGKTEPTR
jgi:hypothetical protein